MEDDGTYAQVILSEERLILPVGKIGTCNFLPDYYIYAGSALGGLNGRLGRHLRAEKRLYWHIDYLLQHARIIETWHCLGEQKMECAWNRIIAQLSDAVPCISGVGSSDCRCRTHLTHFPAMPSFNSFKRNLRNGGLPRPYRSAI